MHREIPKPFSLERSRMATSFHCMNKISKDLCPEAKGGRDSFRSSRKPHVTEVKGWSLKVLRTKVEKIFYITSMRKSKLLIMYIMGSY